MPIRFYNSLTKRKDKFSPLHKGKVGIYVCGVTVYDECHIGHARSLFVFDVIHRYLKYRGFKVKLVRNITDIDDKIIAKARERAQELKAQNSPRDLKQITKEVAQQYIEKYYQDMQTLGIQRADVEPRATEHIPEMIDLIKKLLKKGFAYQVSGNIYLEVRKCPEYGKLSNQSIDQMRAGARLEVDENKKDPLDFALWKEAREDEPSWMSPWGEGRPGWHIECSAMSMKYLGETFDIHCGGRDLIFPHHENEIAQAKSASGKRFVRFWIHNGLLTINGEKMAKSLGNFISIPELASRYHPDILKLFFLGCHYSNPIDFSWDKMEAARRGYNRFCILLDRINRLWQEPCIHSLTPLKLRQRKYGAEIDEARKRFKQAMDDDFNTPSAVSVLFDLLNLCNKFLDKRPKEHIFILKYGLDTILELGRVLGLSFKRVPKDTSERLIETLINVRLDLRKKGDFESADKIRRALKECGIILEDERDKTTWRRQA